MTDNSDDAFMAWLQSDAVQNQLRAWWEAMERERGANAAETREAAQEAALVAEAAFAELSGMASLRRRRLLVELDELAVGTVTSDSDYRRRIDRAVNDDTPAGRTVLRYLLARLSLDDRAVIGAKLADHLAGGLIEVAAGRHGILEVDRRQGTDPGGGAAYVQRIGIVAATGYEAGVLYGNGRVPNTLWAEAAEIHNAAAAILLRSGTPCALVSAKTIRDWCVRKRDKRGVVNEDHARFEDARRRGMHAASLGLVDPKARLGAQRK